MKRPEGFDRGRQPGSGSPSGSGSAASRPAGRGGATGPAAPPSPSTGPAPRASRPSRQRSRPSAPEPEGAAPGSASDAVPVPRSGPRPRLLPARSIDPAEQARRRADHLERSAARAARRAERAEARRFTRRSRRRRLITWGSVAVLTALLATVVAVTLSPLMALTDIRVTGTVRLDPAEIGGALDRHRDTPLALLDQGGIRSDLEGFALIRSYSLEVVPPHSLVVRVIERAPIGAIESGSEFELVDAAGVVVESTPQRPTGVPLIRAGEADPDEAAFRSVAEVLDALPDELATRVDVVTASTRDDVAFTIRDLGHRVVWGSAERSAFKTRVLETAIAVNDPAVAWQFDVSAPDSVIVRRL
ncbi:MAG: FtsQ-type POTRA domain-containing protein [Microcella sp.]|uniref:FtsQ-type POTRA domain-containing protein n=1 Tax=Microcella sp. TaxID=1913979 RepID=UPI00272638E2|nr:FtsQ-type POTRA domain-containing protein [Microcella sp.]MDO8337450.1 FtsQ-type POTRA domain-containing protein [Microcella sp.]